MATIQYGVHILVSGQLVAVLTKEVCKLMREVDTVKVKGSEQPIRLFTIDVQVEELQEITDRFSKLVIKDKKRMMDREKFILWESLKYRAISTISVLRSDNDFSDLRKRYNREFNTNWKEAYKSYIKGDWQEAKRLLQKG